MRVDSVAFEAKDHASFHEAEDPVAGSHLARQWEAHTVTFAGPFVEHLLHILFVHYFVHIDVKSLSDVDEIVVTI